MRARWQEWCRPVSLLAAVIILLVATNVIAGLTLEVFA